MESARPLSLGQEVSTTLKADLLAGRYAPGERLSVHRLAAELGVSKQPVLSAMRQLEVIGLVEIVPQSGCRVADYRADEVRHFFEVFAASEAEVAAVAATRRTDEQLQQLTESWDAMARVVAGADAEESMRRYQQLNRGFHAVVQEMAGSRPAALVSASMWDLSDFFLGTLGGPRTVAMSAERNREHRLILEAIAAAESAQARDLMRQHVCTNIVVVGVQPSS